MNSIPEISPEDLKTRLDRKDTLVLLDVREPQEWDIADIDRPERVRIPVGELVDRMSELDPGDEIVVFCRSGGRSAWAAQQLVAAGYEKAINLEGGILKWREQVDPTLKSY